MPGPLAFLWMTALGLVATSFVALSALIVARILREREQRAHPNRRARISKALVRFAMADAAAPSFSLSSRAERRALIEAALDAAHIMRGAARARLVELLRDLALDRMLQHQARTAKVQDRMRALEALRLFPDPRTSVVLHDAERSSDLRIWLTALQTRTSLGAGPDIYGLLELAGRPGASRSPIMQDLLATRAQENPHEALQALVSGALSVPMRAILARAIGETGRIEALAPLRVALCHPAGQVRSAAAAALGALGFAGAGEALVRATRDSDWRVRLKAAEAIGKLKLWRCAACLEPLLDDRVWWVRFRAEEALLNLNNVGAAQVRTAAAPTSSPAGEPPRKARQ